MCNEVHSTPVLAHDEVLDPLGLASVSGLLTRACLPAIWQPGGLLLPGVKFLPRKRVSVVSRNPLLNWPRVGCGRWDRDGAGKDAFLSPISVNGHRVSTAPRELVRNARGRAEGGR